MNRLGAILLGARWCLATCLLLAMHLSPSPVLADAAPPWTAQGVDIAPGEEPTRVQMISEEVTLTIEPLDSPSGEESVKIYDLMVAHVEAEFLMRNTGEETEAFDVWFPLTTGDAYGPDIPVQAENFCAWVDGEPASIEEAPGGGVPFVENGLSCAGDPLGGGGRRFGAEIGGKVTQGEVRFVANRGDHRDGGCGNCPGDAFLVERPEILE